MAYNDSVLSQLLKLVPRLEFEKQANLCGGQRRRDAWSRWSQFVALTIGQMGDLQLLHGLTAGSFLFDSSARDDSNSLVTVHISPALMVLRTAKTSRVSRVHLPTQAVDPARTRWHEYRL